MATKAERFRAATAVEQAVRRASARPTARVSEGPKPQKAHNLGERAGRSARVAYEAANGRPSRKSTRGSKHHPRAASRLERTKQLEQSSPTVRAALAKGQIIKVRGKVG